MTGTSRHPQAIALDQAEPQEVLGREREENLPTDLPTGKQKNRENLGNLESPENLGILGTIGIMTIGRKNPQWPIETGGYTSEAIGTVTHMNTDKIDKTDRKNNTQLKIQIETTGEKKEEDMDLQEQGHMVTETHEDTAKRFHAWGNLL